MSQFTARHALRALVFPFVFATLCTAACTAEVRTGRHAMVAVPEDVVVAPPPPNIYAYPHTMYRGEPVYYVDGRWYHRRGPSWVYFRREPPDLVRHRRHVHAAPPSRRYAPHTGEAIRVR
jgi:hypothetical protein